MKPTTATTTRRLVVVNIHKAVREPNSTRREIYSLLLLLDPGRRASFRESRYTFSILFSRRGAVQRKAAAAALRWVRVIFYVLCCVFFFLFYLTHTSLGSTFLYSRGHCIVNTTAAAEETL